MEATYRQSNWSRDLLGHSIVPPPIVEALNCPNRCSHQGVCLQFGCVCQPGFSGIDCSLMDGTIVLYFTLHTRQRHVEPAGSLVLSAGIVTGFNSRLRPKTVTEPELNRVQTVGYPVGTVLWKLSSEPAVQPVINRRLNLFNPLLIGGSTCSNRL